MQTLDFAQVRKYHAPNTQGKEGYMVKRLNCHLTDELHKKLRVALAEKGITFSDWVREHIEQFVSEAERERTRGTKGKRKGKEA
jgi:predicted HicB family RNase H-like nuclease